MTERVAKTDSIVGKAGPATNFRLKSAPVAAWGGRRKPPIRGFRHSLLSYRSGKPATIQLAKSRVVLQTSARNW